MSTLSERWRVSGAALLVGFAAGSAPLGAQQTITLEQVYTRLHAANPQLQAANALARAAELREAGTRLPADPAVQIGLLNFGLPQFNTDMPTSMTPALQLMQMVPTPGKLSLAGRVAEQSTRTEQFKAAETWWELRAQAAMAFYELYSADQQLNVMNETLGLLREFQRVAKAMYTAGEGRQSDVLRANVETAKMEAGLVRMRAMRKATAARLNGLLNQPADAEVPPVAIGELAAAAPPLDSLRAWTLALRPMLGGAQARVEQAALQRSLAGKEVWPDLTLGVEYGQRRGGAGTEHMGSVMLGFTVPVFAGKRQLRMRDEASALETMARADLADMRARVDAKLGELLASLERCTTLIALYRTDILPQAEANVKSAFSAYRVGTVDFMTLLDAQMTVNQYRQELHALVAEHGAHWAELEMTVGRELPQGSPLVIGVTQ